MTSDIEKRVEAHYTSYDVLDRIRAAFRAEGYDPDSLSPDDLAPVNEFHIGGLQATQTVLDRFDLGREQTLLDIGSGVGGPARVAARRLGCHVVGVDLTPVFVDTARALSKMCGMDGRVSFKVGSATALPLDDASIGGAMMLHVGMNIPDKPGVMREVARVLQPGGAFVVYDVMQVGEGRLAFPVPWAEDEGGSALVAPAAYREAAAAAGLTLAAEEDRRDAALGFFERIQAQAVTDGPPRIGLHTLLGPTVKEKTGNMMAALRGGLISPVLMVFRAPANKGD